MILISRAHDMIQRGASVTVNGRDVTEYELAKQFDELLFEQFVAAGADVGLFDVHPQRFDVIFLAGVTHVLRLENHFDTAPNFDHAFVLHKGDRLSRRYAEKITAAMRDGLSWDVRDPIEWDRPGYGRAARYFELRGSAVLIEWFSKEARAHAEYFLQPEVMLGMATRVARALFPAR